MKATLKFEIECGEKTCAVEPGKFCQFHMPHLTGKDNCFHFGRLFDGQGEFDGWLMRHQECLKRAGENE